VGVAMEVLSLVSNGVATGIDCVVEFDPVSCGADAVGWIPGGTLFKGIFSGVSDITKSLIKGGAGALGFTTSGFGFAYGVGSTVQDINDRH
jgi:hypothetical protein